MAGRRTGLAYGVACVALVASVFVALAIGASDALEWELVRDLRLPRVVLSVAVGMGLAVAGATLQALFTNPLCEPYTLGISSGSTLGVVLGISLGASGSVAGLAGSAFLGALAFALVLHLISLKPGANNLTLLLAGVMMGFLGSSLVALWLALSDPNGIQSALFWLLGYLSRARMQGAALSLVLISMLILAIWTRWRSLDALLMGEEDAQALGVHVGSVRRGLILLISLLIALCVSGGGMIGFVGLVVPHFVRRQVGSMHRHLIPVSALWGGASLAMADAVSRYLVRPYELPVGVVTALVGAPLFLWIMLGRRRRTE